MIIDKNKSRYSNVLGSIVEGLQVKAVHEEETENDDFLKEKEIYLMYDPEVNLFLFSIPSGKQKYVYGYYNESEVVDKLKELVASHKGVASERTLRSLAVEYGMEGLPIMVDLEYLSRRRWKGKTKDADIVFTGALAGRKLPTSALTYSSWKGRKKGRVMGEDEGRVK